MSDLFGHTEMRALTWKQPFASLMLHGKKETRTWSTSYRGPVLICAGKVPYPFDVVNNDISGSEQMNRIWEKLNYPDFNQLPIGVAIAIGNLVDCYPMERHHADACYVKYRLPWTEDRLTSKGTIKVVRKRLWVHEYKDVKPIERFKFTGCQGWRILDQHIIDKIKIIA